VVDANFAIYTPSIEVFVARFLAAFLLHMELMEDVKQGFKLIVYLNTHPEKFKNLSYPFLIGSM